MSYQAPFPQQLAQVEYVQFYFHLENRDYFDLPELALLQLRREMLLALKNLQAHGESQLRQLLLPPLPDDPVLSRQLQKPAPAMVLSPDVSQFGLIEPKQRIILPVLFVGSATNRLRSFIRLLKQLGAQGLYKGTGHFIVEAIEAEDASGVRSMLWLQGESETELAPPISDLGWWLELQSPVVENCRINVTAPLRLMHHGKPLFKADFSELFPFVLRRVTAFLAHYAQVELEYDAKYFIALSRQITTLENRLQWKDWRTLNNEQGGQNLGGLLGTLDLEANRLADIAWILQLGSLFNFGKGAAFGAGQYHLTVAE
jgi:hypothetical protein